MVSQTRGQSNRSSDEARASMSQTIPVGNPSNIVDPIESGHVLEREIANGNGATNPDETRGSDASDSSDGSESDDSNIRMALDEQSPKPNRLETACENNVSLRISTGRLPLWSKDTEQNPTSNRTHPSKPMLRDRNVPRMKS